MNEIRIIIFRLINFALLLGLFAYIIRKKLLPMLTESMQSNAARKQLLATQKELLIDQRVQAKNDARAQEERVQALLMKIDQWRADQEQRKELQHKMAQRIVAAWQQRQREQLQEYEKLRVYHRAVNAAFEQLDAELHKQFHRSDQCLTFTDNVIQTMKK